MSTATKEETPETLADRIEREMAELRESGVLKKPLPTITRATFGQLTAQSAADFMRAGGKLVDDPTPPKMPLPVGAMKRSEFMNLTHKAKLDFARSGRRLVDDADVANEKTVAEPIKPAEDEEEGNS